MTAHRKSKPKRIEQTAQKRQSHQPGNRVSSRLLTELGSRAVLQRALKSPGQAAPADLLALQRAYGNRAVTRLIQADVAVGPAGDKHEQEADRVADQVIAEPLTQRRVDADIQDNVAGDRGGGRPLPDQIRTLMEPHFGTDFGGVRVHTDGDAAHLTQALQAKSFTHGQDIYFGAGRYQPSLVSGKRLLAHELTHVVQQTGEGQRPSQAWRGPSPIRVRQSAPGSIIQRDLMATDDWLAITRKYSRKKSNTLAELDGLVANYPHQDDVRGQRDVLDNIINRIEGWLGKHRIKKFFGIGMVKRLRRLQENAQAERRLIDQCEQVYQEAGLELPVGLKLPEAHRLARNFTSDDIQPYNPGGWLLELAIYNIAHHLNMGAIFNRYTTKLRSLGFVYDSRGNPIDFYQNASSGNCRNLAQGLSFLGQWAGHDIQPGLVSGEPFATAANATLISAHNGNVRLEGEHDYTAKRYAFDDHVAALSGGTWYDPTVDDTYGNPTQAKVWELKRVSQTRLEFVNVKDGAQFGPPNTAPIGATTAYLEKEGGKESQAFGNFWIVKRKLKTEED